MNYYVCDVCAGKVCEISTGIRDCSERGCAVQKIYHSDSDEWAPIELCSCFKDNQANKELRGGSCE